MYGQAEIYYTPGAKSIIFKPGVFNTLKRRVLISRNPRLCRLSHGKECNFGLLFNTFRKNRHINVKYGEVPVFIGLESLYGDDNVILGLETVFGTLGRRYGDDNGAEAVRTVRKGR